MAKQCHICVMTDSSLLTHLEPPAAPLGWFRAGARALPLQFAGKCGTPRINKGPRVV